MKRLLLLSALLLFWYNSAFSVELSDTFTDSDGTNLASHISDSAHTWIRSFGTDTAYIYNNRVRGTGGSGTVFRSSYTPTSADYNIKVDIHCISVKSTNLMGLIIRHTAGSFTGHIVVFDRVSGSLKLYRAGSVAVLASYAVTLTAGQTATLQLSEVGNIVTVSWNDSPVITYEMIGTNIISSAGSAGIYTQGEVTDTTGDHLDNIETNYDSTPPPPTTTHNVSASDLWDNGYDNVANPRQSTNSRFKFTTNADEITITGTSTIRSSYPNFAHLGLRVNGADQPPLTFSANGQQSFPVSLPGSGTRDVEITSGLQSKPSAIILGSFIDSVTYPETASFSVTTPTVGGRTFVYGDSISVGGNATNPEYAGYVPLLRNTYGKRAMLEGWGYRSLYEDANTTGLRDAFVSKAAAATPSIVWLAIGTNDYGLNKWSASSFGTAYAATVDAINSSYPSAIIICQSPIVRTSEVANGGGSTLSDYREQIDTVCGARGWTRVVDGSKILTTVDLADGVHPSTAGHAKYAEYINTYLDTFQPPAAMMGY